VWFEHLSGAKGSVAPPEGPDGEARLRRLVAGADVLLVDGTSPYEPRVPALRPEHLVEVDLSPFGRSGPYARWRGSDLAVWALGGYLAMTGSPEREPLWLPGSQAELHAGANAAFAALVGLYEQRRHGWGQAVEVSALESVLTAHSWLVSSWAACGQVLPRVGNDLIRASDGWAYVMRIAPNDELFVLIDRPDLAAENLTDEVTTWFANIPRIFEAVAGWAEDQTVEHMVDLGQALRVAVTPVLDAAGVAADPQLAARRWWEDGFPGQPYHLSASPSRRRGPAPAPGEHREREVPDAADRRPPYGAAPCGAPLEGLRVLEVTANWAGPVVGRFLADLGADVVKVERAAKPATRALWWVGPDQDQQRQGHNRAMYFNEMNRGKRDVCLDLARPEGREVFLRLVGWADVLIENNSARVMGNLELDWPVLREVNPRLIMVSMSGYGADGPRRDWLAYGSNIETTSGLTSITGYPDGELSRTGLFYADPVSGIHGAVAVMAALEHRRRTGEGQWVELALNECGAAFCAEALLTLGATGVVPGPSANRDPRFAPHGVYPCAGVDKWVAIAVQADEEWPVLARLAGRADLADDAELVSLEGRWRRHDELDVALAAWTATLEQYEVAWACQRAGVSAAPVLANWQVLPDPHLHHRAFFQPQEHPVVGVYPTPTWPWRFSRTPARLGRPAPLFAEHNREVLAVAGLDEAAVEALYASGATADEPE
jgi:crotonobetainyl-CoA:carnitine CoA-transferase CaiB-like acyl-CoA transferase